MANTFMLIGSLAGFLGVAAGAFGAHGLRNRLSPDMLAVFETAVRYQMYHAFALLITAAAIARIGDARLLSIAGWSFITGIVLFSAARVVTNDIAARGRPLVNSLIAAISVACNIALNVVLIPRYGIDGAAWASTGSYSLLFLATAVIYRRVTGVPLSVAQACVVA